MTRLNDELHFEYCSGDLWLQAKFVQGTCVSYMQNTSSPRRTNVWPYIETVTASLRNINNAGSTYYAWSSYAWSSRQIVRRDIKK